MKSCQYASVDFLIIGGGIAGLWLLADLKAQGYSVLLCESKALGAGQTIASQGIIHGGTKYALTGKVSNATTAIADMPKRWKAALAGQGRVNLSDVNWLSAHQLLWTSPNIASKVTGFFASKVMQSRMQSVPKTDYPKLFQHNDFKGNLYQLDEPVLDIPSLLNSFQQQFSDCIVKIEAQQSALFAVSADELAIPQKSSSTSELQAKKWQFKARLDNRQALTIQAQNIVLSAGEGNAALTQSLNIKAPAMQRRPLHMVMLKSPDLPMIYAHALGVGDKPKMTITSHKDQHNNTVWYIGGEPAEQGVQQSPAELIQTTQQQLQKNLAWMDFNQPDKKMQWSTLRINRAEGQQVEGKRPNQPVVQFIDNLCIAWPTKLAFAPLLSDQINQHYAGLNPINDSYIPSQLATAKVSTAVWDK